MQEVLILHNNIRTVNEPKFVCIPSMNNHLYYCKNCDLKTWQNVLSAFIIRK